MDSFEREKYLQMDSSFIHFHLLSFDGQFAVTYVLQERVWYEVRYKHLGPHKYLLYSSAVNG